MAGGIGGVLDNAMGTATPKVLLQAIAARRALNGASPGPNTLQSIADARANVAGMQPPGTPAMAATSIPRQGNLAPPVGVTQMAPNPVTGNTPDPIPTNTPIPPSSPAAPPAPTGGAGLPPLAVDTPASVRAALDQADMMMGKPPGSPAAAPMTPPQAPQMGKGSVLDAYRADLARQKAVLDAKRAAAQAPAAPPATPPAPPQPLYGGHPSVASQYIAKPLGATPAEVAAAAQGTQHADIMANGGNTPFLDKVGAQQLQQSILANRQAQSGAAFIRNPIAYKASADGYQAQATDLVSQLRSAGLTDAANAAATITHISSKAGKQAARSSLPHEVAQHIPDFLVNHGGK